MTQKVEIIALLRHLHFFFLLLFRFCFVSSWFTGCSAIDSVNQRLYDKAKKISFFWVKRFVVLLVADSFC